MSENQTKQNQLVSPKTVAPLSSDEKLQLLIRAIFDRMIEDRKSGRLRRLNPPILQNGKQQ